MWLFMNISILLKWVIPKNSLKTLGLTYNKCIAFMIKK